MKTIVESHGEHLWPVVIYLDDIENILGILQEVDNNIEIYSGKYQLEDLRELPELKREVLNELRIRRSTSPFVLLDLTPSYIWLHIREDDPISRGLFEKIKAALYLRRRKLAFGSVFGNILYYSATIPVALGIVITSKGLSSGGDILAVMTGVMALFAGSLWLWLGFNQRFRHYSMIIPKNRLDAPSFIKRNKDKIILATFSATLGAILGVLGTLLIINLTAK